MLHLKGLYTVAITPFDEHGHLDEQGFRENLRFQLTHRVDGIVLLGTTGEAPTLTHEEQARIITIGAEEVKGKAVLMVGTGSYSTAEAIEKTAMAKKLGADVALIVTPYYNKPTQEGMYRHFKAIAEAVVLPICVYNIQGRTGTNMQTDTLARLAKIPQIISVKEASGNVSQMMEVIQQVAQYRPGFTVLSGDDALTLPLMALGGHGILSVVSNLCPQPMRQLVDACAKGDFAEARKLHYQLLPFFKAAFIETNPIPIKAAMQASGQAAGSCRLPLCDLMPENFEKLCGVIHQLPTEWLPHGQTQSTHR